MKTKVQQWGNRLALRIPKVLAEETALFQDSVVDLSLENGRLIITPYRPRPVYQLDELLAQITDESLHPEMDWGAPVGREVW